MKDQKTTSEEKPVEKKKRSFRASYRAAMIVASVTIALAIVGISVYVSGSWRGGYYNMKCDIFRRDNKTAEKGKTVFVGDSITDFCDLAKYYPEIDSHNRGISADTTDGLLKRMDISIFDLEPSTIVILMGINDIHIQGREPSRVIANYAEIFAQIRERLPDARLIVQSLYPVRNIQFPDLEEECSEAVLELNAALADIAEDYDAVFADVYPTLADESGRLKENYTDDGLHPNDAGYRASAAVLTPILLSESFDGIVRLPIV